MIAGTLSCDTDANGSYETTHDAAGNLTYDGMYGFTYDAWNRLTRVSRAYRDSGGTLQIGSTIHTIAYDGLGRRISKAVTNSADLNATYHYYYNPGGQSIIETRNGSNQTLKQHVWGITYIDELVQTSLNDDPADGGEQVCESHYWVMQDANFNVLGVVDSSGVLRERYEYTPYGERRVFTSPGVNDPLCYAPIDISKRWTVSSVAQPYGLCEVGHQGLWHDEELGQDAIDNRNRYRKGERFLQRDPNGTTIQSMVTLFGAEPDDGDEVEPHAPSPSTSNTWRQYDDGMNLYQHVLSSPLIHRDPSGLGTIGDACCGGCNWTMGGNVLAQLNWEGVDHTNDNNGGNAFRHCLATCQAAKVCGKKCAKDYWDGRETNKPNFGDAERQDLRNNQVGYKCANENSCWDCCKRKLKNGKLWCRSGNPKQLHRCPKGTPLPHI